MATELPLLFHCASLEVPGGESTLSIPQKFAARVPYLFRRFTCDEPAWMLGRMHGYFAEDMVRIMYFVEADAEVSGRGAERSEGDLAADDRAFWVRYDVATILRCAVAAHGLELRPSLIKNMIAQARDILERMRDEKEVLEALKAVRGTLDLEKLVKMDRTELIDAITKEQEREQKIRAVLEGMHLVYSIPREKVEIKRDSEATHGFTVWYEGREVEIETD